MFIELVMSSSYLILFLPLLLLPSIFPRVRVFSNESVLRIRWPKYWSFSFSISPSNEYSGLISFKIDCFFFFFLWNRKTKKINFQIKFYHLCYCDTCIIFYYCLFGQVKFKVLSVAHTIFDGKRWSEISHIWVCLLRKEILHSTERDGFLNV